MPDFTDNGLDTCNLCNINQPNPPKDNMTDPKRLAALHKGACTSPRAKTCPCPKKCPLHGRCCDCIRSHLDAFREETALGHDMGSGWLPECFKLAAKGRFDGLGEIVVPDSIQ